jgi:ATP-dependent Clp protease ATP-binding subunit ClpA
MKPSKKVSVLLAEAKRVLPPEFYNRIDEAIVFERH